VRRQILHVHGMESIGGAEQDLLLLLRRLDPTQWSPMVACPPQGEFRNRLEALGIPVVPITLPPWRKVSSWVHRQRAVRDFSRLLGICRPHLIHVNDLWWVPHTIRAVERLTPRVIPVVAHVRQHLVPKKVRVYGLDRADRVVAVSRRVQTALEEGGVSPHRVSMVYSGVDMTACSATVDGTSVRMKHEIPSDASLIGTVANLLPIKGYESMIRALPSIRRHVPAVHYLVVGGGAHAYEQQLRALCAEQQVADIVHFVGFQDPVWPYIASMDVYVQPSQDEALGIAAIEAMAMDKAVVATRVGGLSEVVVDGETGFLVEPGDVSALSESVVGLFRDPVRREAMGHGGRRRVSEHFDIEKTLRAINEVYHQALHAADRLT
jgi:glycosyltransferase involved in cell wall biosynthesis